MTIDLSQAYSLQEAADIENAFKNPGGIVTSDHPVPVTLEGLREGLVTAVTDLQKATADAFAGYDEKTSQFYSQIDERLNALVEHTSGTEVVLDSFIKVFLLADKLPPEALTQHLTILENFLKRDLPQVPTANNG
jgi:hypothetical protein